MPARTNKKGRGGSVGRPKPLTPKSGVTKNGKRRYDSGGRVWKKS